MPMKVILSVYGSRGDVQPLAALGLALQGRGHRVTLCAPENFAQWSARVGLPFATVGSDILQLFHRTNVGVMRMTRELRFELSGHFEALTAAARGADLVLGAGVPVAAPSVAELLGATYRFIAFCPLTLRSRYHAPPHFFALGWPRPMNPVLWRVSDWAFDFAGADVINLFRRKSGLLPVRGVWNHVIGKQPLLAADPALAVLPADLASNVVQTGSWVWPRTTPNGEISAELEDFVNAGEPPIYVGFGSMPVADGAALANIVLSATAAVGCRAVISLPRSVRQQMPAHERIQVVEGAPHDALFPRMRAVVHHGGAGTIVTAARSGVPQVVVPHMLDQHYWGHRVAQLGLGPSPIPRRALTSKRLAQRLTLAFSPPVRRRAAEFSTVLQADGLESALDHLVGQAASRIDPTAVQEHVDA